MRHCRHRTVNIFGWAGDDSGCGWHRIRQPFAELENHGYTTRNLTQKPGRLSIRRHFQFDEHPPDLIVGQRIVLPEMLAVWRRLRAHAPLVHELDDDLFHVDARNITAAHVYSRQSVRDTLRHSTWMADLVTVSTEPLADLMVEECDISRDKVVVVPNCVNDELFTIDRKRNDRVTIGYSGGGSHDRDFEMVKQPLRRILDRNPDVMLHSLGHDHRPVVQRPGRVRFSRWNDSIQAYWRAIDFDIALGPLAHTKFNESKSALRALEMGALGIPIVASDEPPYREVVVDGETGFLVRDMSSGPKSWEGRLRTLINDAELREQMGKAAKERVQARWAISVGWRAWDEAYRRLVKG